jgi:hypothetical protein
MCLQSVFFNEPLRTLQNPEEEEKERNELNIFFYTGRANRL